MNWSYWKEKPRSPDMPRWWWVLISVLFFLFAAQGLLDLVA